MSDYDKKTAERHIIIVAVCSAIMGGGIGASVNDAGGGVLAEMFIPVVIVLVLWCIATLIDKTLEH